MINIVVRDEIVELWGTIFDERQREALKVAAENIPGVKAVKDHMVWVEPVSGCSLNRGRRSSRPDRVKFNLFDFISIHFTN